MNIIESLIGIPEYFHRVFVEPYQVAFEAIPQGGDYTTAGVVLLLVALAGHLFILFMLKLIVYNTVFPKLRTIDEYKNRTLHCRLYFKAKPSVDIFRPHNIKSLFEERPQEEESDYYWVKFRLWPVIEFHRVRIDKQWKRRRFPWTLDIFTNAINLQWDPRIQSWELMTEPLKRYDEDIKHYKEQAMEDVREIADNVLTGVKGDYGLIKDKFKLGLAIQKVVKKVEEQEDEDD